jgi:hypothetical protein
MLDGIKDIEDEPMPRSIDVDSYAAFLQGQVYKVLRCDGRRHRITCSIFILSPDNHVL